MAIEETEVPRWAEDHLRALSRLLLPTRPLAEEHCHAEVVRDDGTLDACGRRAERWTICDPHTGEQRAWPVCYDHANTYTNADAWVEVVSAIPWLLDRLTSEPTP